MSDTQRTATEQLLVSHAIDQVVAELDFSELAGKPVYLDVQYLDGTVDRGYLVSSMRQQLLGQGCLVQEDRNKATYVVEARSGGVGTDRHALLIGIPQMNVPAIMPGQPSQIPEIPFAKKTDQEGYAKIAVFAYNRLTGQLIWQSGVAKAMSTSKDTWILGAGPFQQGTIRQHTEFAGEPLPIPKFIEKENREEDGPTLTHEASWPEWAGTATDSKRVAYLLSNVPIADRIPISDHDRAMLDLLHENPFPARISANTQSWPWNALTSPAPAPEPKPAPVTPNLGGQAETEPAQIDFNAWGLTPSDFRPPPRAVTESATGSKAD